MCEFCGMHVRLETDLRIKPSKATLGDSAMAKKQAVKIVAKGAFVMPTLPHSLKLDPLLASLLHTVSFLEFSDDDTVDPDWAVEAMESVGYYLQKLTPRQIADVKSQLSRIVAYAKKKKMPEDFVEFLDAFLENAGVGGTEDDE